MTDLTQRRDELKRLINAVESDRERCSVMIRNYVKELSEIESQLSRPEPKYEVGQEAVLREAMEYPQKITWRDFDRGIWLYSFGHITKYNEGELALPPILVADEAEREFLLDMKAAREVAGGMLFGNENMFRWLTHPNSNNVFEDFLESKRPGALERLRK